MKPKTKINVYFNEYNLLMGSGGVAYLPLVSGILSANAKKDNNFLLFETHNHNLFYSDCHIIFI